MSERLKRPLAQHVRPRPHSRFCLRLRSSPVSPYSLFLLSVRVWLEALLVNPMTRMNRLNRISATRGPLLRKIPQETLNRRYEATQALVEKLVRHQAQDSELQDREETASLKQQVDAFDRRSCREQSSARLAAWGRCIRYRRVSKRMTAQALCERMSVSLSTLRRVERGDAMVAASTYLVALAQLSIFGELLREPPDHLLRKPITDGRLAENHYPRSRLRKWSRRTISL